MSDKPAFLSKLPPAWHALAKYSVYINRVAPDGRKINAATGHTGLSWSDAKSAAHAIETTLGAEGQMIAVIMLDNPEETTAEYRRTASRSTAAQPC